MSEAQRRCSKCREPVNIPSDSDVAALVDGLGEPLFQGCFALWQQTNPAPEPKPVEPRPSKYQFTEEMGEISGFGGGYEETCRNMLKAALEWFDANPKADPKFKGFEGVYGLIVEDNVDAKELSKVVVKASNNDCSGAMHQAVISSALWIQKNGWEQYCQQMKKA